MSDIASSDAAPTVDTAAAAPATPAAAVDAVTIAPQQLQELQKRAEQFEAVRQKYQSDENFRKTFDAAWNGQQAAAPQRAAPVSSDPMTRIQQELAETRKQLQDLGHGIQARDVYTERENNNMMYQHVFTKRAEAEGYEVNTPAYRALNEQVQAKITAIGKKYGLVDASGRVDPLVQYNENVMNEAFEQAMQSHKEAGFYDAWQTKKQALAVQREREKPSPYQGLLSDKKALSTAEGRASVFRKMAEGVMAKYRT